MQKKLSNLLTDFSDKFLILRSIMSERIAFQREKIIMFAAQDVIKAFLGLPEKEQEKVKHFINSTHDDVDFLIKGFEAEYVREEDYSPEDIAKLDRIQEEAEQGINMSPTYKSKKEALAHLDRLEGKAATI